LPCESGFSRVVDFPRSAFDAVRTEFLPGVLFGREDFCPVAVFEVPETCAVDLPKSRAFASFDPAF